MKQHPALCGIRIATERLRMVHRLNLSLRLREGEGLTYRAMGIRMGISTERARQIYNKAVRRRANKPWLAKADAKRNQATSGIQNPAAATPCNTPASLYHPDS